MAHEAVDLAQKLSVLSEHWSPNVVARLDGYEIEVVKVKGEFVWHTHDDTDQLFIGHRVEDRHPIREIARGHGDCAQVPAHRRHCRALRERGGSGAARAQLGQLHEP